jgi:hypothetical protein
VGSVKAMTRRTKMVILNQWFLVKSVVEVVGHIASKGIYDVKVTLISTLQGIPAVWSLVKLATLCVLIRGGASSAKYARSAKKKAMTYVTQQIL